MLFYDRRVVFFMVILVGFVVAVATPQRPVLADTPLMSDVLLTEPPEDEGEEETKPSLGDLFKRKKKDAEEPPDKDEPAEDVEKEALSSDEGESKRDKANDAEDDEEEEKSSTPQVEVFVPSVLALSDAFKASKTAALYGAVSQIIPKPRQESDEDFDIGAALKLIEKISTWPNTSLALTTYTQDREGRPRWALRVDWPLKDLADNLRELLEDEIAAKILENVELIDNEDGTYQLELPDVVLAVLSKAGGGALIASAADFQPPDTVYGQASDGGSKKKSLIYCRLNLNAGDEDEKGSSLFSSISGISDIRYRVTLKKSGRWSERWGVVWNPLVGGMIKTVFKKAKQSFKCPKDAYALAVMNLGLGGGAADGIAGLPPRTIGSRVGSEMAYAAVPGTGFLPFPDLFYQFKAKKKKDVIEDIRKFIEKDNKKRSDDDRPPAWYEEEIDDRVVFWKDPSAGGSYGLMSLDYRTVLFFEETGEDESKKTYLIVAQTSTWADDAVQRWKDLTKDTVKMPSSKKAHWQARIRWRHIYELAQPYLGLLSSLSEDSSIPPEADELDDALVDSRIDFRISAGGLRVSHQGPVPVGAIYVPTVVSVSLGSTAAPTSELARERTACRHLRVLYHHAKLFKEDFERWPATVAELDGYVDFTTYAYLLNLRPKEKTFAEGLVSMFVRKDDDETEEEEAIDDSLYVIDWSEEESEWKLKLRDGEFVNYQTIYIDAEGKIHRVEKTSEDDKKEKSSKKKRQVTL
ncbi:MAG: hypothetical protein MI923_05210 [Phycisphaerales bacterium]|nr:hypothetical protein [Phycisphaerales bacterium]